MIRGVGAYHPHTDVCYNYANLTDEVAEELLNLCPHYIDRILKVEDFNKHFEPTFPAYQRIRGEETNSADEVDADFLINAGEDEEQQYPEEEVVNE